MATSIRKLLRRQATEHVANLLGKLHPADVSHLIAELNLRERISVFSVLMKKDRALAAGTLTEVGPEQGQEILLNLSREDASLLLQEMAGDDAAVFISALPETVAEELLELMRVEDSAVVQDLLNYEEETAGRIMTPHVFALPEDLSVSEAIHAIQTTQDLEMVFYLYVVDERGHLVGVTSLRQLLTVPPSTPLKKTMTTDVVSVRTDTDQEEVARLVAQYDILAIPVVDSENKLVGMITVDDVIDIIKEEATEDIFYMAGVETDDHVYTPARASVRKRLPWLVVNLATAFVAATVVGMFEPTIKEFSFLAIFMPVVAGMGGNAGTQTLTVIVRGLALGEVKWGTGKKALIKELAVGMSNGLVTGVLAGVVSFLWKQNFLLGLVLGLAMVINLFVAGFMGTLIPLTLKKLDIDPAIASGIVLTTFTDVVGFMSFLGLATIILRYFPVL